MEVATVPIVDQADCDPYCGEVFQRSTTIHSSQPRTKLAIFGMCPEKLVHVGSHVKGVHAKEDTACFFANLSACFEKWRNCARASDRVMCDEYELPDVIANLRWNSQEAASFVARQLLA